MPATFSKQELSSSPLGNGGPYQNAYLEKKKNSRDWAFHYDFKAIFIPQGSWCGISSELFPNCVPLYLNFTIWAFFHHMLPIEKVLMSYIFSHYTIPFWFLYTYQLNSCPYYPQTMDMDYILFILRVRCVHLVNLKFSLVVDVIRRVQWGFLCAISSLLWLYSGDIFSKELFLLKEV